MFALYSVTSVEKIMRSLVKRLYTIQTTTVLVLLLALIMCAIGMLQWSLWKNEKKAQTNYVVECTPAAPDDGGPYYLPDSPFRENLAPDNTKGERLIMRGKILRSDCKTPVADAVLDIWQADEAGNYQDKWYRGRVRTSQDGSYLFEAVKPKGYGEGTDFRPPHIHFKVWEKGKLLITSQMFLPGADGPGVGNAPMISLLSSATNDIFRHNGIFTIVLP